jgi:hypothetical protein
MIDSSNITADLFVRKGRVRILKQLRGTNPDPGLVIDWSIVEVYLYSPREGGGGPPDWSSVEGVPVSPQVVGSARLVLC